MVKLFLTIENRLWSKVVGTVQKRPSACSFLRSACDPFKVRRDCVCMCVVDLERMRQVKRQCIMLYYSLLTLFVFFTRYYSSSVWDIFSILYSELIISIYIYINFLYSIDFVNALHKFNLDFSEHIYHRVKLQCLAIWRIIHKDLYLKQCFFLPPRSVERSWEILEAN